MGSTHVRLEGSAELEKILKDLVRVVVEVGQDALTEWGKDVRDHARRTVVVDTGNLGSAIEARLDRKRLKSEVGLWEDDAYYGQYVEAGTSSQPAQPFLEPAFHKYKDLTPYIQAAWAKKVGSL